MFRIGNVEIANHCLLAPMAGYGDKAFRQMCREGGAGLSCTEMISCKGLNYKNQQTIEMLSVSNLEKPCAVQLFGKDPNDFERAVQDERLSGFDIIDINMGCPVNKVIKHGEGSGLMETPELASLIVSACVKASNGRPITVKHRLGVECGNNISVDFAKRLQDAGASAVSIHGRYQQQHYRGESDWQAIGVVADNVQIPVVGSGDIVDRQRYEKVLNNYPVAAVMVARASIGNPTVFAEMLGLQSNLSPHATMEQCRRHLDLHMQYNKNPNALAIFKKHFASYINTIKVKLIGTDCKFTASYFSQLKVKAHNVSNLNEAYDIIDNIVCDLG
ncbi:MAG: tRNA-dihydrouridine synthase family protein [Firmicutes bacterium]|nr:tRNA-dihydrouridine synthase family protein [Bacillota bacterium]MCL1953870.1 tRNA-dihydrouridine synthase family protein [Bacillota bacterium]